MIGTGMNWARSRARLLQRIAAQDFATTEVLDIMEQVPRHAFVDEAMTHRAYDDIVLPIGFRQTISQPTVVAMMSSAAAAVSDRTRVLEIGTGCGYQTAILARLFREVYTMERIEPLQARARRTLETLGIENVHFKFADGHAGWLESGPFNAVLGTASAETVPEDLWEQVTLHGRLIMPVNESSYGGQLLVQWERTPQGFVRKVLSGVRFVPMLKGVQTAT